MNCKDMKYFIYYHRNLHPLNKKVIDIQNVIYSQFYTDGASGLPYRIDLNVVLNIAEKVFNLKGRSLLQILKGIQIMQDNIIMPKVEKERKKLEDEIKRAKRLK